MEAMMRLITCSNYCACDLHRCVSKSHRQERFPGFNPPDAPPTDGPCFRMKLRSTTKAYSEFNITAVSISCPPDTINRNLTDIEFVQFVMNKSYVIEVALIGSNDSLTYSHPLCCDVLRYESMNELIEGLCEIADYTKMVTRGNSGGSRDDEPPDASVAVDEDGGDPENTVAKMTTIFKGTGVSKPESRPQSPEHVDSQPARSVSPPKVRPKEKPFENAELLKFCSGLQMCGSQRPMWTHPDGSVLPIPPPK